MSIKLMSLVFDTTFQPTPKIVLMALADRADDNGGSLWPGVKEVARKSSLSERQTQRVLHWLDGLGLVPVVGNQYGGKPGDTVQRRINVQLLRSYANGSPAPRMSDSTGDKTAPVKGKTGDKTAPVTGDMEDAGRVTSKTETGDMGVTQYTSDPSVDTPPPPKPPKGGDGGRFDAFWSAYPKKVGKDAARKAFERRKVGAELLVVMLKAIGTQAHSQEWTKDGGQYIPNPSTWLNQGRWQDELTPAHAAATPAATDRKSRQLAAAAVLTGTAPAPQSQAFEVIDVSCNRIASS